MKLEQIHRPILGLACLLPLFSPRVLSGDSAFYLHAAVTGEKLIHPHHLSYNLILRSFYLAGSKLGMESVPYYPLRAGVVLIAVGAVLATYAFLRKLPVSDFVAAVGSIIVSASGLFWQFAAQFEAYIPMYAALAWTTALCLHISEAQSNAARIRRTLQAAVVYAFATTLHQAAVLAAPALALLTYLGSTNCAPASSRARAIYAAMLLAGAGAVSLSCYLIGWRIAKPGLPFTFWITTYAHWEGMPWGLMSHFSATGVKQLTLSWGASWFSFDALEFYSGVPGRYKTPVLILGMVFICAGAAVFNQALRRHYASRHFFWILLWLVPVEIFILWWTPFLKNFQALVIVPQIALLALAADQVWSGNRSRAAGNAGLLILALIVLGVNIRYMVIRSLKVPLAPEGDLVIAREFLRADDLFVAELPNKLNMQSLIGFHNVTDLRHALKTQPWPKWTSTPLESRRRVVVHKSSLYVAAIALQRWNTSYEAVWGPFLEAIETAAGGADRLRGELIVTSQGPLIAIFGTDSALPLTRNELLLEIAAGAEYEKLSPHGFEKTFLQRILPESPAGERNKRQTKTGAVKDAPLTATVQTIE